MNYLEIDENNITNDQIKKVFYSIETDIYDEADYLIIYGCHIKEILEERLLHAIKILNTKKIHKVIITGGVGKLGNFNESEYMLEFLLQNGINKNNIIIEDKSTTTKENNENILKILNLNNVNKKTKIVICTHEPHLIRVKLHLNKLITNNNIEILVDYPEDSMLSYENIINNPKYREEIKNQMRAIKYFVDKGIYLPK